MDELLSEKEQIEKIRNWWAENGRFVIGGLVLGVAALVGWNRWNNFVQVRGERASVQFAEMLQAVERSDRDKAEELALSLNKDYAATPYAPQSALLLARLAVEAGQYDKAADQLQALISTTDDARLAVVGRLRLARVRLAQDRPDDAWAVLQQVKPGKFASQYHELRGDTQLARGDSENARNEYQLALDNFEDGLADRSLLEMKLGDLTPAEGNEGSS